MLLRYAFQYSTINITDAEYDIVYFLMKNNHFVHAIKFIRCQYKTGLKEAKDICDTIAEKPREVIPYNYVGE